jgi:hypothetical protein
MERSKPAWRIADGSWCHPMVEAERRNDTSRLADVPFHRMEPIAAVGDLGDAETFAGCQQVVQSLWQQCSERYLERIGRYVEAATTRRTGMKINSIAADADGVRERRSAIGPQTCCNTDVSFQHHELSSDPTALPHVRRCSQAILCTKHLRTQPQSGISGSAIWSRCSRLHPVDETERQLTRPPKGLRPLRGRHADQWREPVVDLRPIENSDIADLVGVMSAIPNPTKVHRSCSPCWANRGRLNGRPVSGSGVVQPS